MASEEAVSSILALLSSKARLDRDKGCAALETFLEEHKNKADNVALFESQIFCLLADDKSWEKRLGGLLAARRIISHRLCQRTFAERLQDVCMKLFLDEEYRVRIESGVLLGELCRWLGVEIYELCRARLFEAIRDNLERDLGQLQDASPEQQMLLSKLTESSPSPRGGSGRNTPVAADAADIFHDTAGWKALETSMKCLSAMVEGCGARFEQSLSQELLDLISCSLSHTNRFVRETGFLLCGSIIKSTMDCEVGASPMKSDGLSCSVSSSSSSVSTGIPPSSTSILVRDFGDQFATYLARGLADNWSQVRWAASVATRSFLLSIKDESARQGFYHHLLPRMCLNRYYVAEGVRIYSQESWRRVVGDRGKELVTIYINEMVGFYVDQSRADNHAVREAACACIAELASKISVDSVRPHVNKLLPALVDCFKDDSWPVRDAACLATGNFIQCFPEECRPMLPELYELFLINLADNIPSVREGAAVALAKVASIYGEEAVRFLCETAEERLPKVHDQPDVSKKYSQLESGPATFGVVKQAHDNDMDLHSNQQMYSCGSLAPKMGRGGGCSGQSHFRRPTEPWELSEGCVHLVAELCQLPVAVKQASLLLPKIASACRVRHYTHHLSYLEAACKKIPGIARGLGKRNFKPHLHEFMEPIFYSVESDNALLKSAGEECLTHLNHFLGPNIFAGRVEMFDPKYLPVLQRLMGRA